MPTPLKIKTNNTAVMVDSSIKSKTRDPEELTTVSTRLSLGELM